MDAILKIARVLIVLITFTSVERTFAGRSVYIGHTQTQGIVFENAGSLHQYVGQLVRPLRTNPAAVHEAVRPAADAHMCPKCLRWKDRARPTTVGHAFLKDYQAAFL